MRCRMMAGVDVELQVSWPAASAEAILFSPMRPTRITYQEALPMTATIDDAGMASTPAEAERSVVTPNIGHVLFIALLVGAFALLWLVAYEQLTNLVWGSSLLSGQRWAIPVGAVFFSLLVGLLEKYMRAPDVAEGG